MPPAGSAHLDATFASLHFPSKPKYSYSDASSFRPYHAILVQGVVFVEARPGRLQFDGLGSRVHALGRKKSKPHGPRRPEPSLPGQARSRPSLTDPHIELLRRYIYIYMGAPLFGVPYIFRYAI